MKILVTGCGRSGTEYIHHIIKALGLHVGHEKMGKNGTVDWHKASILKKNHNKYDVIFHQIRHPVKTIASMQVTNSWKFISKFIPSISNKEIVEKGMLYWYYWNKAVEPYSHFTYQLEQIKDPQVFGRFCELLKVKADFSVFKKVESNTKNFHRRKHEDLTWENLENENKDLSDKIKILAEKYGYEI